jgi:hypothetical protein
MQFISVRDIRPGHRVRLKDETDELRGLLRVIRISEEGCCVTVEGSGREVPIPIEKIDAAVHVIEL